MTLFVFIKTWLMMMVDRVREIRIPPFVVPPLLSPSHPPLPPPPRPGRTLRKKGLNRIGNLIVPNHNYCSFEDWINPILGQVGPHRTACSTCSPLRCVFDVFATAAITNCRNVASAMRMTVASDRATHATTQGRHIDFLAGRSRVGLCALRFLLFWAHMAAGVLFSLPPDPARGC